MQKIKGKSSRKLLEIQHLPQSSSDGGDIFGREAFFAASSGNVTDEIILEYIRTQILRNKIKIARYRHNMSPQLGFQPTSS